jgi:hypothetical protein
VKIGASQVSPIYPTRTLLEGADVVAFLEQPDKVSAMRRAVISRVLFI